MRSFKFLVNSLLLLTIPCVPLSSQDSLNTYETPQQLPQTDFLFSYDTAIDLVDSIENGEMEGNYNEFELEQIAYFLANAAEQGLLPQEMEKNFELQSDIQELLSDEEDTFEYASCLTPGKQFIFFPATFSSQGEVILCKSWVKKKWKQVKKFCKKHKKEIIIGAAVVVATVIVVGVVAASSAGAAATGAAAAASDKEDKESSHGKDKQTAASTSEQSSFTSTSSMMNEAPLFKSVVEDHVSAYKEKVANEIASQSSGQSMAQQETTLIETVRNFGSTLAHETWDGVSKLASIFPYAFEEIKNATYQLLPASLVPQGDADITPAKNFDNIVAAGHERIDDAFSTDKAGYYASGARDNKFTTGEIPLPGTALAGRVARVGTAAGEAAAVGRVGRSALKGPNIQNAGSSVEAIKGKFLTETQARDVLHQAGIPTFPRPAGIPEDFRIKLSKKTGGMKYVHSNHTHESIRVMPGKPHSPNPAQQKPYVIHMRDGKALDKFGNVVDCESVEAHIPLEEFVYKGK